MSYAKEFLKSYDVKAAIDDDRTITGAASVVGNIDRGSDCIFPGAWKGAIKGFKESGFVAVGHNWKDLPVAFPTDAKEKGNTLECVAKFHTTQAAEDARTVSKERIDAGLSVGLSVGFRCGSDSYKYFQNGQKMLDFAKDNGFDIALFDTDQIKKYKNWCCGILKIDELYEFSIVSVPMNQAANAIAVKSHEFAKDVLPDGLTLQDHLDSTLAVVEGALGRLESIQSKREAQGRGLSQDRLVFVKALHDRLAALGALMVDSDTTDDAVDVKALHARSLALRSSLLAGSIPL